MQTLKYNNSNALSESVEHLLADMVESQGSTDELSAVSRLTRLGEAFRAIQKCLEMQQNNGFDHGGSSGSLSPRNTVFTEALR